jgi:hypothetical protein
MYGNEYQKALKSGTIVATLLLTVSLVTQQLAQAQQSQDRGLLGNFGDGNRDGLAAGAADYREGYDKYAYCPGGTADYCAGFVVGYDDGYNSARKVG